MFNSFWYNSLNKPLLSPPDYVFAPVWAFLYLTIFVTLFIYFLKKHKNKKDGYIYFCIQILLNIIWSPTFFVLKNIGFALLVIILLDIFVFLTIRTFYSVTKISGIILIPYFLWIIFATYLNIGYFLLN